MSIQRSIQSLISCGRNSSIFRINRASLSSLACSRVSTQRANLPAVNAMVKRYQSTSPISEKSFNQVILLGRVGVEPVLRGSEEKPVLIFSLATNYSFKNSDNEPSSKTEWHRVSIFRKSLGQMCRQYLHKGTRVMVTGHLLYGEVLDAKGVTHQSTTIVAEDLIFLSGGKSPDKQ